MANVADDVEVQLGPKKFGFNFESGAKVLAEKQFTIAHNNFFLGVQMPPLIVSFVGDQRFDDLTKFAHDLNEAVVHRDMRTLTDLGLSKKVAAELISSKDEVREEKYTEIFDAKIQDVYGPYDQDVSGEGKLAEGFARLGINLEDLKKMDKQAVEKTLFDAFEKKANEVGRDQAKKMVSEVLDAAVKEQDGADKKYERITADNVESTRLLGKGSPNPDIGPICRHVAPLMGAMMAAAGRDNQVFTCRVGNPELIRRGRMGPDQHASVFLTAYQAIAEATDKPELSYKKTAVAITDPESNGRCFIFYDKQGQVNYYDNIPRTILSLGENPPDRFPEQLAAVKKFIERHKGGPNSAFSEAVTKHTPPQNIDYRTLPPEIETMRRQTEALAK